MSLRPYPEGLAWDEAWRQRKRADRLQSFKDAVQEAYTNNTDPTAFEISVWNRQEVERRWRG